MFPYDHVSSESPVKYFKSVEDECSQKIKEFMLRNASEKELALLYNNRGHAKYMQVEFYSAIDDYNKALQYDSSLAVTYYNRGTIQYRMGNFEAAVDEMGKALSLDPSNAEFIEGYNESKIMLSSKKQ